MFKKFYFFILMMILSNQSYASKAGDRVVKAGQYIIDILQAGGVVFIVVAVAVAGYTVVIDRKPITDGLKRILIGALLIGGATVIGTEIYSLLN